MSLPLIHTARHALLLAKVLQEAQGSYEQGFKRKFAVVFHPSWDENSFIFQKLVKLFEQNKVRYFDFAHVPVTPAHVINPSCDGHPSGESNSRLARLLEKPIERLLFE